MSVPGTDRPRTPGERRGETDPLLTLLSAVASTGALTVHNARGGFACNSSSSHSIVVLPEGMALDGDTFDVDNDGFDWQDFALVDSSDKIRYLGAMLHRRPAIADVVQKLCADHDIDLSPGAHVDHQSHISLPVDFHGTDVDREFLADFAAFLTNPRVAILGGNDNDGSGQHLRDGMVKLALRKYGAWRARKDSTDAGTWWVLFNTDDGTKLRVSFDADTIVANSRENPNQYGEGPHLRVQGSFTPEKAATPELVDVKLTDACAYEKDCGFCFSGETEFITRDGVRTLKEAVGTTQMVLSSRAIKDGAPPEHALGDFGGEWVEAEIRSFGVQKLMKVTLTLFGVEKVVFATPEHRWLYTPKRNSKGDLKTRRIVTTAELKTGTRLAPLFGRRAIVQGPVPTRPSPFGAAHGFVFGDGALTNRGGSDVNLYGAKDAALLPYFALCKQRKWANENGTPAVHVVDLPAYFKHRPSLGESASYLYGWLAGYFAADGAIAEGVGSPGLDSASRENLEFAQAVCNVLGIGTYEIKEYVRAGIRGVVAPRYRLRLMAQTLTPDFFIIPEHRRRFEARMNDVRTQAAHAAWTVKAVEESDREEEVFCAVVPEHQNFTLAGNINVMNCYMGSTKDGQSGDPAKVANLLAALAELNVFEVAFGGGEPTLWPAFTDILTYTRSLGITPNFTTKNYTWLTSDKARTWLDQIGSVAFSVNTRTAMDRLLTKADKSDLQWGDRYKITVQLIPDLVPVKDFEYIVTQAAQRYWRVTLLGYKTTGRGSDFTPRFRRKSGSWLKTCAKIRKEHRGLQVAIDTLLAEQSRDALEAAGVPSWMYHLEEGRFSAYADAVTGRMGPSSYCDPDAMTALDLTRPADDVAARFNATFAGYLPTSPDGSGPAPKSLQESAQEPSQEPAHTVEVAS